MCPRTPYEIPPEGKLGFIQWQLNDYKFLSKKYNYCMFFNNFSEGSLGVELVFLVSQINNPLYYIFTVLSDSPKEPFCTRQ